MVSTSRSKRSTGRDVSHPPENSRPLKRQRLQRPRIPDSDIEDSSESDGLPWQQPPPKPARSAAPPTGCRIYQPKYRTNHEPTFVTQLTQPSSSPSAIRGPRWQKPQPKPPQQERPQQEPPNQPSAHKENSTDEFDTSDEDMKAAIIESLNSFREETVALQATYPHQKINTNNTNNNGEGNSFTGASSSKGSNITNKDLALELEFEKLQDEAYDSSPYPSPTRNPAPPKIPSSVFQSNSFFQSSSNRLSGSQQQKYRQTTLFGGIAPDSVSASQTVARSWPLANRDEPPTHHALNDETLQTWIYPKNLGQKREYQFNISQRGIFHNLLVALPTGLGKTFIAATVMLNWFRWTKNAQLVFVAPTRPLVSQQIDACYHIAGIPRSETTMLTGNIPPALRGQEWETKRVFFMTPQTLINDLKSGIADPKRIVLLVVDEAHRATGAYVYVEVVKFIQRFNSSIRVLALTATPGSTVETVQEVIDGLNISRVEIRTEESLDIREYIHSRSVETVTFSNSPEMISAMEKFSKALQPVVDKLRNLNAYYGSDPMTLTPFGLTEARRKWMASPAAKASNWAIKGMVNSIFTVLASAAHGIELLKYHGIGPFFRNISTFESRIRNPEDSKGGGKYPRQIIDDMNFKSLMVTLRSQVNNDDFIGHPKLEYLKRVVLNHFLDAESNSSGNSASNTRIMIFSHFRDSAEEIVKVLKHHAPIVLPHVFVGQANTKGSDGMDQKTQLDIINKFKSGVYNTIVATSIGEEGLDIGEVDLIVCYDSSASPVRMLQRMGRTGRKRQGNVVLLLMKGKEEEKYMRAKDNYEKMQQIIASGTRFTFHDDKSPRILPREIQPSVEEKYIEIPIENTQPGLPEPTKKRGRLPKKPPKKFHMPDGVETGFMNASKLDESTKKKRKTSGTERRKKVSRSPELADIPPLSEVLLTPGQQLELKVKFQTVSGTSPQIVHLPRNDAFPSLQRSCRPTSIIRHGPLTQNMVKAVRKMATFGPECDAEYEKYLPSDIENWEPAGILHSPVSDADEDSPMASGSRPTPSSRSRHINRSQRPNDSWPFSSLMCSQLSVNQPLEDLPFPTQNSIEDHNLFFDALFGEASPKPAIPPRKEDASAGGQQPARKSPLKKSVRRRYVINDDTDS
ncbi:3'-5' DNA helicase [Myotisia sp. PD_48]|nr:3'-5' DNA helicase [Myotisia sp. PD_48]